MGLEESESQKWQKQSVGGTGSLRQEEGAARGVKGEGAERDQRRLEDLMQFMIKQGGLQRARLSRRIEQGWRLLRETAWGL